MTFISALFFLQIDYFNNKPICDLVEKPRQGIMAVLDDACFGVGNVTDQVCFTREGFTHAKCHLSSFLICVHLYF